MTGFEPADRVWTLAEANEALPAVTEVVERIRALREEASTRAGPRSARARRNGHEEDLGGSLAFASAMRELSDQGIVVRDLDTGLVDFPARSPSGRAYWLCWVVGEPEVAWWHWPEDGFAGRAPIGDPPA
jgi:hypothetical protein